MNRHLYRIVFNKKRGLLMAVAECATGDGKSAGTGERSRERASPASTLCATLRGVAFGLFLALGMAVLAPSASAQIVAYKAAPASQRPTVLSAGNGVPLVNIQTPSAAGVSRNTYEQFDVASQGAILNNSRNNAQTQLGGWVQGNPWLAAGTARVILNEVVAANPSQLLGHVEIAGSKAEIVIANPAGVTCNGCGFINASRATLTTGTPVVNGGNLDGYRVTDGTLRIEGAGMNATGADATALIARAVEINAGLWANDLKITTGANAVDADNQQATPIPPATGSPTPAFAIDVARLGGMYAGKIVLVGTETGVGVRNAGHLGASAGEVRISVDGKLINTGEIVATGNFAIAATNLENRNLIDGRDGRIDITGTLDNLGTARLYGDHLAIAAGTLNNHAEVVDGAPSAPTVAARDRLDLGVTTLSNQNKALIFSGGDMAIGGALDGSHRATGTAGLVLNRGATLEATRALDIAASETHNTNTGLVTQTIVENSRLVQEVQPESWPQRHDVSYFPSIFDHGIEKQPYVVDGVVVARFEDYTFYEYTATTTATRVVSSQPGKILAGHSATIIGNLENNDSQIVAGGTLTHTGGTLSNIATPGERITTYNGWAQFRDWDGKSEKLKFKAVVPYNPAPMVTGFDLGAAAWSEASPPAGVGTPPVSAGSGLYRPAVGAHYLIETDPAFANYRQWLSSDYMLQQLSADPATTQKRLGDGFYEQRLITEQVASLTGRRFLAGYENEEAQYRALMNAGVTVAKEWQLIPGIALSDAQVARLTTDIVWLVEKAVILPDGSHTTALVPTLYALPRSGDLNPAGSLLSGEILNIAATGDVRNSGTLAGRTRVALTAENIQNLGGTVAGDSVQIAARQNFDMQGGSIEAGGLLDLLAGQNLTVASVTHDTETLGGGSFSRTHIKRAAGLYVQNPDGQLRLAAANDVTLLAAQVVSQGSANLYAGGDLTLGTVSVKEANHTGGKGYRNESGSSTEIGTYIEGHNDVTLLAGSTLTARAANVSAQQGTILARANDIVLEAGEARQYSDISQQKKSSGFLSSKSKSQRDAFDSTTALSTTFSGDTVTLAAGNDLTVKGSSVVATGDLTAVAGRALTLEAATETHAETHYQKTTQSGLFSSGGFGFTIGSKMLSTDQQSTRTTAAASTVGSVEGNVTLTAGEAYRQIGSDVLAPGGDIAITARTVDILEARERNRTTFETKAKQSGLTIAITSPVISAVQTAQQMSQAAKDTKDSRMQLLAAANVGLSAYSTYDAIDKGQGTTTTIDGVTKDNQIVTKTDAAGNALESRDATAGERIGGINLSVSIGSSSSRSKSTQTSDTAAGSTLQAGGDLSISATGAGEQSDITVQGSDLAAGKNLTLKAEDEIKLLAAANTAEQHSTNKSSSASVGFSVGTDGFLVNVGASAGKGKADGADLAWTNSHATAGETLTLQSGGDATLKGAVAQGEQVVADVGGDLKIESLQDQSTYRSKQQSAGFSLSIGYGKISGSVSASQSKVKSDYASVTEQSGLKAGDEGFQVKVAGDTDLQGAVIASSQRALDAGKNRFETGGTLTMEDLHNHAEYEAKSTSVNIGSSLSFDGKLKPGGTGGGFGKDSDSAESTTKSGITGIAGNTQVRTGDPESGIAKIFDAEKVQKEIEAQTKITQMFGQQASKAVGDYAASQLKTATDLRSQGREEEAKAIEALWDETGTLRIAAHTVIGGLTGGASGAAGSLAGTITAPLVAEELAKAGIDGNLATALTALTSTAVGGAVGGSTGAGTALNEVANNYLSHSEDEARHKASKACAGEDDAGCREYARLDALDKQRDAQHHLACDGASSSQACADATHDLYEKLGTFALADARKAASNDKTGELAQAHKKELQSYFDLIKMANADVRTSTETKVRAPNEYDADPYGVVNKDNTKDAYLVMKFGTEALAIANVNENGHYTFTEWAARNGMRNDPSYATGLMLTHVDAAADLKQQTTQDTNYTPVDRYTLSYAPTGWVLSDLWGTLLTKIGIESESVLGLRSQMEYIQASGQTVNWVAHSRGGTEFVQAAQGSSMESLKYNSVVFHAGANTKGATDTAMAEKSIGDVIKDTNKYRYRDAPNDLVPQIVGLRALTSPLNFLSSLWALPRVFGDDIEKSPHTLPYQWNKLQKGGN